ncbi:MAG: hypothetical protein KGS61_20205, partial [Verrucomicrobia bacterium]|nr:hypothetical protein [Verrucomicrobiota bacterium]
VPAPAPEVLKTEPPPPAPTAPTEVTPVVTPSPAVPPTPAPTASEPAKPRPAVSAPTPLPVEPKVEGPPPKRIVTREGVVRRTGSIQAPSLFELCSEESDQAIDYLHSYANHVVLKKFNRKHVIVTGEEMIDPRWPKTPVLEIDTIEVAP